MRCERCQFENIPSRNTCVKCGSILELPPEQIIVNPPRMPIWKRPHRYLLRLMRKGKIIPPRDLKLHFPSWIARGLDDTLCAMVISVIPGMAHIFQRRFKEIQRYFLVWAALLATGLFLYGSQAGFICIGLAIGVHTGIAVQYKILKEMDNIIKKTAIFIIILIVLTVIYRYSPGILIPNLSGGYSSINIPHQKITTGDFLFGWHNSKQNTVLKRGDLVFIHPVMIEHGWRGTNKSRQQTVVQIVGLPGEQLKIKDGAFIVKGEQLDADMYPMPQWLQMNNFSVIIPDNSYFINIEYNVMVNNPMAHNAQNIALNAEYINRVCIINTNDIESKIFMLWWPLTKRGFIR